MDQSYVLNSVSLSEEYLENRDDEHAECPTDIISSLKVDANMPEWTTKSRKPLFVIRLFKKYVNRIIKHEDKKLKIIKNFWYLYCKYNVIY